MKIAFSGRVRLAFLHEWMVFVLAAASGCATVVHGTTQSIEILSDPPGAQALVLPQEQRVTTPATVKLKRSNVYTVIFTKEGFLPMTVYVNKEESAAIIGNLLIGGLVGLNADLDDGAAWYLEPDPVRATLRPQVLPAGSEVDGKPGQGR